MSTTFIHSTLAIAMILQSWIIVRRSPHQFSLLLFSTLYFIYFALSPLAFPDAIRSSLDGAVVVSLFFMFGANIHLALLLTSLKKTKIVVKSAAPETIEAVSLSAKVLFWSSFVVISLHMTLNGVPVLQEDPNIARLQLGGSGYIKIFLTRAMPLALILLFAAEWLRANKILTHRTITYSILFFAVTFLQGFRIHLIYGALYILSFYFLVHRRVNVTLLTVGAALCGVVFFAITSLRFGTTDVGVLTDVFQHRIGLELLRTTSYAIDIASNTGFWLGGSIAMDLQSALPGEGKSFGDYMLFYVDPASAIVGLAALTPSIVGEAYVNFGYIGAFVFGWLFIMALVTIPRILINIQGLGLALAALVPVTMTQAIEVGVGQLLASRLIPLMLFALIAYVTYRIKAARSASKGTRDRRNVAVVTKV